MAKIIVTVYVAKVGSKLYCKEGSTLETNFHRMFKKEWFSLCWTEIPVPSWYI